MKDYYGERSLLSSLISDTEISISKVKGSIESETERLEKLQKC